MVRGYVSKKCEKSGRRATKSLAVALLGWLAGCAYGGVAAVGTKHAIVTKNGFLGMTRNIYVCRVTTAGIEGCSELEQP